MYGHVFPNQCSDECFDYQIETITPYEAMGKVIDIIHKHTCVRCGYDDLIVQNNSVNVRRL